MAGQPFDRGRIESVSTFSGLSPQWHSGFIIGFDAMPEPFARLDYKKGQDAGKALHEWMTEIGVPHKCIPTWTTE